MRAAPCGLPHAHCNARSNALLTKFAVETQSLQKLSLKEHTCVLTDRIGRFSSSTSSGYLPGSGMESSIFPLLGETRKGNNRTHTRFTKTQWQSYHNPSHPNNEYVIKRVLLESTLFSQDNKNPKITQMHAIFRSQEIAISQKNI